MIEVAVDVAAEREAKTTTLIGKRVPKLDAPEKATGLARYIEDLKLPRMLYGKILFADRPHARIVDIDTSAAEAMPGVRAVITGSDIELVPFGFGQDNTALKADKVTSLRGDLELKRSAGEEPAASEEIPLRIGLGHDGFWAIHSPVDRLHIRCGAHNHGEYLILRSAAAVRFHSERQEQLTQNAEVVSSDPTPDS